MQPIKRLLYIGDSTIRFHCLARWAAENKRIIDIINPNEIVNDSLPIKIENNIKNFDPDTIIIFYNRPKQIFDTLMQHKDKIRIAYWHGDWTPLKNRWFSLQMEEYYSYNQPISYLFTVSDGHNNMYKRDLNPKIVSFLPHDFVYCYRNDLHFDENFQSKVAFIGQCGAGASDECYRDRKQFVSFLKDKGCPIRCFPDMDNIAINEWSNVYSIRASEHKQRYLGPTYGSGCIFLGIDTKVIHNTCRYMSSRPFTTLGYKAFYLTWHSKGIEDLFIIGKHIDVFKDFEEGYDKIQYYLKHQDVCKKIGETGFQLINEKHLPTHRCRDMITTIETDTPTFSGLV